MNRAKGRARAVKHADLKAKAREVEYSVDVRAFIANRYGTVFDAQGKGTCPCRENHRNGDATPSFTVDAQGRCRCWSQSCFGDKPADLFNVIMVKEKVGFAEAVRIVEGRPVHTTVVSNRQHQPVVTEYVYPDRHGEPLLRVTRTDFPDGSKRFAQFSPNGNDGWKAGTNGLKAPLYKLPEVTDGDDPVVVVEGEKCAEALRTIGVNATTCAGGAGKFTQEHAEQLLGREVVVWPDNDERGRNHADKVCTLLEGRAASLHHVTPPEWLPKGGDVVDVFEAHGEDEVRRLVDEAQHWEPSETTNSSKQKDSEKAKECYSADFPGLVDLVAGDEGQTCYLIDVDGTLTPVNETPGEDNEILKPPPKDLIPWLLPRVAEVLKYYTLQAKLSVQQQDELLFDEIVSYLKKVSELPRPEYYDLLAAWIMHTYLLTAFQYSAIICLFAVAERGKTRTGKALTYMSYRGLHVESLREAYILRVASNLRAGLFFDVMDLWQKAVKSGSEDIILQRFERGVKVPRVNNPDRGPFKDTTYYDIFGPTVIGTNESLHRILDTRAITINMPDSERTFEEDITPELALPLKERLLLFRANHMKGTLPVVAKPSKGRLGDILRPLLQIIVMVRPDRQESFMKLVRDIQSDRIAEKSDSPEAEILRAVIDCESKVDQGFLRVKDIMDSVNRPRDERYHLSPQRVGKRLAAMGFTKGKLGSDRAIQWKDDAVERLRASYGLSEDMSHTSHMS